VGGGIYSIRCLVNGKVYIGSTFSFAKRFKSHSFHLNRGDHRNILLQRAWLKYGAENFTFSVLETIEKVDHLLAREQIWMDSTQNKFNILPLAGATRGVKRSEETKARMSAANKGQVVSAEQRAATSARQLGKKASDETRVKMSLARMGKKLPAFSDDHRAKMSLARMGKKRTFTSQHCEALRKSATGRVMSEEAKVKMSMAKKGVKKVFTEQHKANIKAAWQRRKKEQVNDE